MGDAGAFQLRRGDRQVRRRPAPRCNPVGGQRGPARAADLRGYRAPVQAIANVLAGHGIRRGDAVLLVLPRITLWQAAYIGALRLGAIVIPCTSMLREKDLVYRANHSGARAIIAGVENAAMIAELRKQCPSIERYLIAGAARTGWMSLQEEMGRALEAFKPANTKSSEPAICYYTSGTTREPKAVLHSHGYAYSHRFTGVNWLDARPGGLHWTTSDTGWAKAAYGVLFGPWMNGVTTFMYNGRFDPSKELELIGRYGVTTFCAPPTEYRILIKENLAHYSFPKLRHCTGAGEPLNPEVIEVWRDRLGLTIRDGFGQTETAILAANVPAMPVKPGSTGCRFRVTTCACSTIRWPKRRSMKSARSRCG